MYKGLLRVLALLCKSHDVPWKQKLTTETEVFQGQSPFQFHLHNSPHDEKNLISQQKHIIKFRNSKFRGRNTVNIIFGDTKWTFEIFSFQENSQPIFFKKILKAIFSEFVKCQMVILKRVICMIL